MGTLVLAASASDALLKPSPGLMIWTLVTFLIALWVLKRKAFGPIQKAIDARRDAIAEMVETAEKTRAEAADLLEQQKAHLAEARGEADSIIARARTAGDELTARIRAESEAQRQEQLDETKKQVQVEVEKAMDQLRVGLAEMTASATEKVVLGAFDASSHDRLIEQTIGELDLDRLQKVGAGS